MKSLPVHGRGASYDPPNRFTGLQVKRDAWTDPEDPGPGTRFYRDASRSIVVTNDSPDVGFEASLNPYRGCEHGCIYCLAPETQILYADLTWRPIGDARAGDVLVGFDEDPPPGRTPALRRSVVEDLWWSRGPTTTLVTDRAEVVTTADHLWLRHGEPGWSRTGRLEPGDRLRQISIPSRAGSPADLQRTMIGRPFGPRRARRTAAAERRVAPELEELSLRSERVVRVEAGPVRSVVDITTSTGTFFAAGLATHNCYARPGHEYLGLSPGLDFETKIFVKEDAPELLRETLASPEWEPKVLVMSGVTDPYQPVERRLGLTRRCLRVLAEFRNPVSIITKNYGVTRDIDLLGELAGHDAARVTLSVTTLRNELQRVMEPRTAVPKRRLRAIRELAEAGIPVGVNVAPVVPGLTEHEMPEILEAAADAGATRAGYILLRLPHAVKELFAEWLEHHAPDRKEKVLGRIRELRGGRLNDPRFGSRMKGKGPHAEQIRQLFEVTCRRLGLGDDDRGGSTAVFRRPHGSGGQLELF